MRKSGFSPSLAIAVLIIVSIVPLWIAWNYPIYLNDDSYITLTYAKNIADGRGFVFNHPPPTQGTTTPLLTLTVAGLASIFPFIEIPALAIFFTAFCWIGIVWVFFLFRRCWDLTVFHAVIVGLVIIASGFVHHLGMEAYLFAFLLVLSLSFFLSERHFITGLIAGFLFLTRGEGILILPVMIIYSIVTLLLRKKTYKYETIKPSLLLLAGFMLPVLLWFAYAFFTFDHVLPNTLAAKKAQMQSGMWRSMPYRLLREWAPNWGRNFRIAGISVLNLWWLLVAIGVGSAMAKKRRWLILIAWMMTYIIGYAILRVAAYGWYQLPILFVLQLFFTLGLSRLIDWSIRYIPSRAAGIGASICIVALALFGLSKPVRKFPEYEGHPKSKSYLELSHWFRTNTQPSESIAYMEIGYLGYYTGNRIIDLAGLVTPDITPHISARDFAWGFWHYQPDYYIYLPEFDRAVSDIHASPDFHVLYRQEATLAGPKNIDFIIYRRNNPD